MAKNKVFKRLSGSGTFTVPAGVTVLTLYPVFGGLVKGIYGNIARTFDGKGYAWGPNTSGRVGDGTTTNKLTPTAIAGGHTFVQLHDGGTDGACGLDIDGRAWVWGSNSNGQIGDGTTAGKSTPTQVFGGHRFMQIAYAPNGSVAALKQNGEVWAWGNGVSGRLGNGGTGNQSTPVQVVGGHSFVKIACYRDGFYALKENGEVWSWGAAGSGQLGDGTIDNKSTPVLVLGGHSFVDISGSIFNGYALKQNGEVWAWGSGFDGMLGNGDNGNQSSPVQVVGGHSFVKIQGGHQRSMCLALKSNGEVWSWGINTEGQLGDGTTGSKSTPVLVLGGHSFVEIATGGNGSCFAMKENGEVWAWGNNNNGQLALGDTANRSTPTLITSGPRFSPLQPMSPLTSLFVRPGQQIPYDLPSYFGTIQLSLNGLILEYEA